MMKCWIEKEELLMADSNFENKMIDDFKKMLGSKVEFYQPTILYYEEIKINRKETKSISFPFVPPNIFKTEKDAEIFAAIYIKALIHDGNLPEEAVTVDGKVNEEIVKVYVNKVILTGIEVDSEG